MKTMKTRRKHWKCWMKQIGAACLAVTMLMSTTSLAAPKDVKSVDLTGYSLRTIELESSTDIFNSTLAPEESIDLNVFGIFLKGNPMLETSLSDLEFQAVHAPWGEPSKDTNQNGSALITIEGNVYEKGLAFQPTTMITIPLDGKYNKLRAQAGVDDKGGEAARAALEFYLDKTFVEEVNFSGSAKNDDGVTILDTTEIPDYKSEVVARNESPRLTDIEIDVTGAQSITIYLNPEGATTDDWVSLVNPVLVEGEASEEPGEPIRVDLSTVPGADIQYEAKTVYSTTTVNKPNATVIHVDDNGKVMAAEDGGIGEVKVTAKVGENGKNVSASKRFINRPFYREYEKTLTMKLFLNDSVYYQDANGNYDCEDICTFEEALELIREVDNLTSGIPKIIYLVGWQDKGHDNQWPSWDPALVDKDLCPEGMEGAEALRWLINEAKKYNTTVSLHLNLFDVDKESPDYQKYVEADAIAKDLDGNILRKVEGNGSVNEVCEYMVCYTKAWEAGLFQDKIDYLLEQVPELVDGGTIHVDAFHSYWYVNTSYNGKNTISPWHAKNEGITEEVETDTQRKIFEYAREKGVDITSEGVGFLRTNKFIGLQPMTWWSISDLNQLEIPAQLYTGGQGNALRYGDNLHGEDIFLNNMRANREATEGFLDRFALSTLQFQYLNEQRRISESGGKVTYTGNITATDHEIIQDGDVIIRQGGDAFTPALWSKDYKKIIAYSQNGYTDKAWKLPADWSEVQAVDVYTLTKDGMQKLALDQPVTERNVTLTLKRGQGVAIVPTGTEIETIPAEEEIDKADLVKLIEYAKIQQELKDYKYLVPAVKTSFEKALAKAEAVNVDGKATQTEVDAAYDKLLKMVHMLDFTGNNTKLDEMVQQVKSLKEELYTASTWAVFEAARTEAQGVLDDENALQAEIDEARVALRNAIFGLRLIPDKGQLEELIKDAETVDTANYTVKSATAFAAALDNAKAVFADENATEEDVKAAEKALEEAQKNLVAKENPEKDADKVVNADTDKKDADKVAGADADTDKKADNKVASDNGSKKEASKSAAKTGDAGAVLPAAMAGVAALAAVMVFKKKKQI